MTRLKRAVLLYYCYQATKAVGFYRPVLVLYLLAQGLSYTQIGLLEGLYALTTVVGEIPTGYFGDRIGRRNSLLLGTVLVTVALIGIGAAGSFPILIVFYIVWSMGHNFRSGSDDAWLYDTLSGQASTSEFTRIRGRGTAAGLVVSGIGSIVGGYLGDIYLSLPFYLAAFVTALGSVALVLLPRTFDSADVRSVGIRETFAAIRVSVSQRSLRWFIVYQFMLIVPIVDVLGLQIQPVTQTVLIDAGMASTTVKPILGWLYALFSILGAIVSYHTGLIEDRIGYRRWFFVVPFLCGAGLLSLSLVPVLALPVFIFVRGTFEATRSLASSYVNQYIDPSSRNTVISSLALVGSLATIPAEAAGGLVADTFSPLVVLIVAGSVLTTGVVFLSFTRPPILRAKSASSVRTTIE